MPRRQNKNLPMQEFYYDPDRDSGNLFFNTYRAILLIKKLMFFIGNDYVSFKNIEYLIKFSATVRNFLGPK